MISVVILTLNDEATLPDCLESVRWCDDVVVFDSRSTDRTAEIARAAGARVAERDFDDFAAQRNHALEDVEYKHPWVFHLDADERFTPRVGMNSQGAKAQRGRAATKGEESAARCG